MQPPEALHSSLNPMAKPPSQLIKEVFHSDTFHYPPTDEFCLTVAKKTLLSVDEVKHWLDHLYTIKKNRARGAAQAAQTRKLKKQHRSKLKVHIIVVYAKHLIKSLLTKLKSGLDVIRVIHGFTSNA